MIDIFVKLGADKYGTPIYLPTTAGYIAIVVLLIIALLIASALRGKTDAKKKPIDVRALAFCAMAIALAFVCSYLKLFEMPMGGSVTLFSMFFVTFAGYLFGLRTGLLAGFAYGLLQLIADPYVITPMQLVLDYCLAFTALGLAGLFSNSRFGMIKGFLVGATGRFVCSALSGYFFFGSWAPEGWSALPYALAYNSTYIYTEVAITLAVIALPPVSAGLAQVKRFANGN